MPQIMTASWFAKLPAGAISVGVSRGVPRGKAGYQWLRELEPGHGLIRSPLSNT